MHALYSPFHAATIPPNSLSLYRMTSLVLPQHHRQVTMPTRTSEILLVTGFGHGHLFCIMELCNRIAFHKRKATLVVFSHLYSSIHPSFTENPLVDVVQIHSPSPRPGLPRNMQLETYGKLAETVEELLSLPLRPVCAIVNSFILLDWTKEIFKRFGVPTVAYFGSGACSPCLEVASYKARPETIAPGEVRPLPGLPDEMALSVLNIKRRPFGPPPSTENSDNTPKRRMGPPGPGEKPPWMDDISDTIGLMMNTFDDFELPFLDYLCKEFGKPAWGVGPLLPEDYWKKSESGRVVRDGDHRANQASNMMEQDILEWLDTQPRGSVIYISFGSTLNLTDQESKELDEALAESPWPFIRLIPAGSTDHNPGAEEVTGKKGLTIRGWAPQLSILSHPSTGGFLSHCGWNSTIEAILLGVAFLTCPIRGDQYDNARLVVEHLKLGYALSEDPSRYLNKGDFANGIEKLMSDEEMKKRAKEFISKFGDGFPASSDKAIDALIDLVENEKPI